MKRSSIINNIAYPNVTAEIVAKAIREGIVTFEELCQIPEFSSEKRKQVKEILIGYNAEDTVFKSAQSLSELREFKKKYPNSERIEEVNKEIAKKEKEEEEKRNREIERIENNINNYTPDEVKEILGEVSLKKLCEKLSIDYDIVDKYDEPPLDFNDIIPQEKNDIPSNYTDVFFWGIPSSGKSCALSVILNTINKKYSMDDPDIDKKFGATYRDSLIEIFKYDTGYLPASTNTDRTQYMPFQLKRRKEKNYRKISFFELSGEVFEYFYDIVNMRATHTIPNADIKNEEAHMSLADKKKNQRVRGFKTLNILLNSENQKIHFFFIDYNQAIQKKHEQEKYLKAAATYFRDYNDIFKKKTIAVYVVVTKADEIKEKNKTNVAKSFLYENFGDFMDRVQIRCEKNSINFTVKIFSIGEVMFSKICKINREYAVDIIEELLESVKPFEEENWITKLLKR